MKQSRPWFELDPNLTIETMGFVQKIDYHPDRRGVPYWILVLVEKGHRTLYADGAPIEIGAHEFFLLPPYTEQKAFRMDDHTACFVHFLAQGGRIDIPHRVSPNKLRIPLYGVLPAAPDCFAHLRFLCDHALSPYADDQFLALQLQSILSLISLECQKNPLQAERSNLQGEELLQYIKENACRPLRAEDYENAFGRSYHHLNFLFKKQFGYTVKQYHSRVRMEYAARMLISGSSLQETAEKCGFDDYFFFINSFTKAHGVSPAAYRKLHGG
ncbi:MAG: helix-turn-helix domain-containing protein [Clostridia bacterium]|nr:helix-turn-helix domain-containing protein [Clostridia bacterium]